MIYLVPDEHLPEVTEYVEARQKMGCRDMKLLFQPWLGQHVLSAPGLTNSIHAKLSLSHMESYA